MKPFLKLITEVGPLAVFFIGNAKYGIFYATGAFMIATAIAIPISWKIEGIQLNTPALVSPEVIADKLDIDWCRYTLKKAG